MTLNTTSPPYTLCLYHNDPDGRASAAIVRRALGPGVRCQEATYGGPLPWERIEKAQRVVIVDFSFPRAEMERLAQKRELIWIDHHITAINDLEPVAADWPGLRDTRQAACVLTWRYFFPEHPTPRGIILIGDRDTWALTEPDARPFGEGLLQGSSHPDNDNLWKPLLDDDSSFVDALIERGRQLLDVRMHNMRRTVARYGYVVTFEGYRTLAVNFRGDGDMGQHIRDLGYQIAYCYVDSIQNGRLMTIVTMFSGEVNVAEIAQRFGGGGHVGAAGFSFERGPLPFPPGAQVSW
jgi:oligoribonuclease NrnB/cAMP/cGMP phosphodiesterase (DHH superfamily)